MIAAVGRPDGYRIGHALPNAPCEWRTDSRKLWAFSFWLQERSRRPSPPRQHEVGRRGTPMDDVLHAVDLDRRPVALHGGDLAPAVAGSSFWYDGFGWPSGVPPYPPRSHCDPQVNRELAVIPVSTW